MSDLLLQPPRPVVVAVASHDDQEQNAMWDSVALAALTEDDDDDDDDEGDDEAKDRDEEKNDEGRDEIGPTASSDIGRAQSGAKEGHNSNASTDSGGGNAFGEYQQHASFSAYRYFWHNVFFLSARRIVAFFDLCAVKSIVLPSVPNETTHMTHTLDLLIIGYLFLSFLYINK